MVSLTSWVERNKEELPALVEKIISDKVTAMDRRTPKPVGPDHVHKGDKHDKYYEARRSLRMWPLMDLSDDVVRDFLVTNLAFDQERADTMEWADTMEFRSKRLPSTRRGDPEYQALVTFGDSRQRDEVKASARNLTDPTVGVQMDPPDHLRSHYQTIYIYNVFRQF